MTHRLATNYAKNYCNRTLILKVIVENVVTCFFGTRCRYEAVGLFFANSRKSEARDGRTNRLTDGVQRLNRSKHPFERPFRRVVCTHRQLNIIIFF